MPARLRTRLAAGALLGSALLMAGGAHATGVTTGSSPHAMDLPPEPDTPKAGCFTDEDSQSDSGYAWGLNTTRVYPADLEIADVTVGTRNHSLVVHTRFTTFIETSLQHMGPRLDVVFRLGDANVRVVWAKPNTNYEALSRARNNNSSTAFPFGLTWPATDPLSKPSVRSEPIGATKGVDSSGRTFVKVWIPFSTLQTWSGVDMRNGVTVTNLQVFAKLLTTSAAVQNDAPNNMVSNLNWNDNDLEIDKAPEGSSADPKLSYDIGTDPRGCFPALPTKLAILGSTRVQYGDVASLSAKLTLDEDGSPLNDKAVSFSIPGKAAVTDTTDENGVARVNLAHGKTAGDYTLTVRFAGDTEGTARTVTTKLYVVAEKTSLAIAKNASAKTATVTLTDDDGKLVGGVPVQWYVNGARRSISTTNSKGVATYRGAPGQKVYGVALAVTGKYLQAKSKTVAL